MKHLQAVWMMWLLSILVTGVTELKAQDCDLELDLPVVKPEIVPVVVLAHKPGTNQPSKPRENPPPLPTPPPAPTPAPTPIKDDPKDIPAPTFYGEEIVSESATLVYVIDISGSMSEFSEPYVDVAGCQQRGPRIDRAKAELVRSIETLSANFRFNIFTFSCSVDRWSSKLEVANAAKKAAACAWVLALSCGGGTNTAGGAELALTQHPENEAVALLTDGNPNCGFSFVSEPKDAIIEQTRDVADCHRRWIRRSNHQNAHVNVIGIGPDGPMRQFCQNVASDNNGFYKEVP